MPKYNQSGISTKIALPFTQMRRGVCQKLCVSHVASSLPLSRPCRSCVARRGAPRGAQEVARFGRAMEPKGRGHTYDAIHWQKIRETT